MHFLPESILSSCFLDFASSSTLSLNLQKLAKYYRNEKTMQASINDVIQEHSNNWSKQKM